MRKEWRYFLLALGFFTRIPTPSFPDFKEEELNQSTKYFPLTGILVGLVGAMVFLLGRQWFPQTIAILMSMAATVYLTGAFHEDGLADSADGIGGGWGREQILTIMQDSRLGTYGAMALFGMLFGKFQVLNAMPTSFIPLALIAGHALSRLCAVWLMATASYTRVNGKSKPLATLISPSQLLLANVFGLLPWLSLVLLMSASQHSMELIVRFVLYTLGSVALVWWWWRHKILKNIQGYTGDTLGAMQQLTELAFYLAVLGWSAR
jgi:adenosylcobinamide-GDP ribazoletransferase